MATFISLVALVYLIVTIGSFVSNYYFRKKRNFSNKVIIDKTGLTDESFYNIKMIFKWDKILAIVVGQETVTFLTDTPVYFYFNISEKEKIMKAIKKYGHLDKVIEK